MIKDDTLLPELRDFLGGFPGSVARDLPDLDAPLDDFVIAAFENVVDRTTYLAWVARYKALIKRAEEEIRHQKTLRFDEATQDDAQFNRYRLARHVRVAIQLRRLGKRWSVLQKNRRADAA